MSFKNVLIRQIALVAALLLLPQSLVAADESAFFESRIRPLLVDNCIRCHGEEKQRAGLRLDSREGWAKGGESGPAIVPGDPDKSPLIKAIRWNDPECTMPPDKKMADTQIAALEHWVKSGAHDPRRLATSKDPVKDWAAHYEERRKWWSLQPVRALTIPPRLDPAWSTPVDRFLFQRIRQEKLDPAPLASPATLIRRASLVLTGMPPSPAEVAAFAIACQTDRNATYAALVDRLMASPGFGERFARHWLDVVRFTETHGNEWNYDLPHAWRYRDHMIRAFNLDVPYDQMVREHIAGDLLAKPRRNPLDDSDESALATAFYRFGEVNHDSCIDFNIIGYDIVDNQLDTLTKAFQATTVACARCHDHKMDPVSARDYHALLGVLRSSRSVQRTLDGPEANRANLSGMITAKARIRAGLAKAWQGNLARITSEKLQSLTVAAKEKATSQDNPLRPFAMACKPGAPLAVAEWAKAAAGHARERAENEKFNGGNFRTVADFRKEMPSGWETEGLGMRDGIGRPGDFAVATDGDTAIKRFLPSGLFTFALSEKLNGALRSPKLARTHGKLSFEVIGGHHSMARLVFNNCQLDYTRQQSLHHEEWSWVTIDYSTDTERYHPRAELLTFWDSPKFPDPLGTLGKDTDNQRGPFAEHSKNPRTWWGIRRVVAHDCGETPKADLGHLAGLYDGPPPQSLDQAVALYRRISARVIESFAAGKASDEDIRWLEWLRLNGLITNAPGADLAALFKEYRKLEADLKPPQVAPGFADAGPALPQPVLARGDPAKPGELVSPGYVRALTPGGFVFNPAGSGRGEVARLIASADNPLTARVMVNRVWQWVFGKGLVATPDDFGHLGGLPSHPELLDHLAGRFMAEGWSLKRLTRELVMSRAFQADGAQNQAAKERDPLNQTLSHFPSRRAEAEVIRDSVLAVSGRLDPVMFGASVQPFREKADPEKRLFAGPLDGEGRRSIYLKFQLMEAPHFLRVFNLPGGKIVQGRRDTTNNPSQSLALLNDPFMLSMAAFWANRLVADGLPSLEERVDSMFLAALGRPAVSHERQRFVDAVRALAGAHGISDSAIMASREVWGDAAHALFNLKEFYFIP